MRQRQTMQWLGICFLEPDSPGLAHDPYLFHIIEGAPGMTVAASLTER